MPVYLPKSTFLHTQWCFVIHLPSVSSMGSAFCCVHLCTCVNACFELVLVSLYSQWSSVVHMHMDHAVIVVPFCLRVSALFHPALLSTVYIISVSQVPFFPSAWGLIAGLPRLASNGSSLIWGLAANSGSSWMYGVDTQPLFSDAVVTCFYTIDNSIYYINTCEIPSELSRENLISSHVKITCYLQA